MKSNTLLTSAVITLASAGSLLAGDFLHSPQAASPSLHSYSEDLLGWDLSRGWFAPAGVHNHTDAGLARRSRYIHPLTVEAAFNDGDFFVDYVYASFDEEDEHEIEVELELALTRRFGIVLEAAYVFENEDGATEEGFADLGVAGRAVLVEQERFIATANLELGIPIGDEDFSADELVVEPGLLMWIDLGDGFTLNTAVGLEIGTESDEFEFKFDAALLKDFGKFALALESRNTVELRGDERGDITSDGTLGLIYRLNKSTSLRGGWNFPISNDEFNGGGLLSLNYSF